MNTNPTNLKILDRTHWRVVELVVSQLAVPLLLSMSNHTRQVQD